MPKSGKTLLPEPRPQRTWKELAKVWGPVVALVVIGFALAIASLDPAPPKELRMAAGAPEGAYYGFAQRYREHLAAEGVNLEVLETQGSVENLELLEAGEVDLALVQGGVADGSETAEALASVFFEPVWLFLREEMEVERPADLAGARIAVGAAGSGTRALVLQLLAGNGVGPENAELLELSGGEAAAALDGGRADAAFFVASPQAGYLGPLARRDDLELFSFRREQAYRHAFPFLSVVVLGEGVFDLEENVPVEEKHLLATAASLAAREDLHAGLVPLLMKTMSEVHGSEGLFSEPGTFPSTRWVELELDDDARQYLVHGPSFLHRFLPFTVATQLDRMKILLLPLLTLLLPLARVAPPVYRWRLRSKIYRWYEHLRRIDEALRSGDAEIDRVRLEEILDELERDVMNEVSVPLSYMDEYYRLRTQIGYVREQAERVGKAPREESNGEAR